MIFSRATMRSTWARGTSVADFAAMNRDAAHVDLQEKRSGMDAADFDAAAGDAFNFSDKAAAHQRLE